MAEILDGEEPGMFDVKIRYLQSKKQIVADVSRLGSV